MPESVHIPARHSVRTLFYLDDAKQLSQLPLINGVAQRFGSEYKATEVQFDPKHMYFSANIATAYPEEANVKKWIVRTAWERTH